MLVILIIKKLFVFANLIAYRAGSLARRLAGSRAFSAAASTQRLIDHSFINSFNMFFNFKPSLDNHDTLFYLVLIYNARPFTLILKKH